MTNSRENRIRRSARREGYLLRKARTRNRADDSFGLYVLVEDRGGNRLPGAQAAVSEFANGWGRNLDDIELELQHLSNR
jgi:hypothetical protein